MKGWLGVALFSALSAATHWALALQVETLHSNGAADARFNIAVLGDGYREQDQAKLKSDAEGIVDYLFGVSPLRQYARFFNVKLIHVVSQDEGADNGSFGAQRNTALDAGFNCNGIDRLLCVNDGKASTIAAEDVPEFNFAIVIVNDPKYGGSGGSVCASSANSESFEVMAHEIGHSLAHLADEYSYDGGIGPCNQQQDCDEANATVRSQRDQLKWRDWLDQQTPLPTPTTSQWANVIGLFEGARYQETGTYRPKLSCKMRDLGVDYCAVCSEQFVRSFWSFENIRMIESSAPSQQNVLSDDCAAIELAVTSPPITPSTYRYTWSVDGEALPDQTASVTLDPAALKQGAHQVSLLLEDATDLVRSDPDGLLQERRSWTVSISRDCVGGSAGMGGSSGGSAGAAGSSASAGASSGGAGASGGGGGGSDTAGTSSTQAGSGGAPINIAGTTNAAGTSNAAGNANPAASPPPSQSAGCGCAIPPRSDASSSSLALLLLAAFSARRRRS